MYLQVIQKIPSEARMRLKNKSQKNPEHKPPSYKDQNAFLFLTKPWVQGIILRYHDVLVSFLLQNLKNRKIYNTMRPNHFYLLPFFSRLLLLLLLSSSLLLLVLLIIYLNSLLLLETDFFQILTYDIPRFKLALSVYPINVIFNFFSMLNTYNY